MKDISAFLADIRNQFITDLPARLDTMETLVLTLEKAGNFDSSFEELYRTAHSLKGSAGIHGLHILSTIAHHLENELTYIGSQNKNNGHLQTDKLLNNIDLSRQALEQIRCGNNDFTDIEQRLEQQYLVNGDHYSRVLLLESSQVISKMIEQVLSAYPVQLETCDNGYTALQRLLLEPFDIVISHIEAPMLNGIALIAALRLSDPCRNITSILLTAKTQRPLNRDIDPDYIVLKNENFIDNFAKVIEDSVGNRLS